MAGISITLAGYLGTQPEMQTRGANAFVSVRVGCTESYRDAQGEWQQRDTVWHTVECWGRDAVQVVQNFSQGDPIIVAGTLAASTWETDEGEKRTRTFVRPTAIGPNLLAPPKTNKPAGASASATPSAAPASAPDAAAPTPDMGAASRQADPSASAAAESWADQA